MEGLEESLTEIIAEQVQSKHEDLLKEALRVWGVDETNHLQVQERCEMVYLTNTEGPYMKELRIDGNTALIWTNFVFDQVQCFSDPSLPLTFSASFQCSGVIHPKKDNDV